MRTRVRWPMHLEKVVGLKGRGKRRMGDRNEVKDGKGEMEKEESEG